MTWVWLVASAMKRPPKRLTEPKRGPVASPDLTRGGTVVVTFFWDWSGSGAVAGAAARPEPEAAAGQKHRQHRGQPERPTRRRRLDDGPRRRQVVGGDAHILDAHVHGGRRPAVVRGETNGVE